MSSVTSWTDILTQNRLKPWWEDARTWAVGLMLASSLFLSYNFETDDAVKCRPYNQTSVNMRAADTNYVNAVCVGDFNKTLYTGTVNVVGTALLMLINTWWLQSRRVRRAITSIRKADDVLMLVKFLPSKVIAYGTEPWTARTSPPVSSDDPAPATSAAMTSSIQAYSRLRNSFQNISKVRDAGRKIWLRDTRIFSGAGPSITLLYLLSNLTSIVATLGLLAATYVLGLRVEDHIFTCVDKPAFSGLEHDTYFCVQSVSSQLVSFIVLYYLLGLAQVLIAVGAAIAAATRFQSTKGLTGLQRTMLDNAFILRFSRQSRELEESTQVLMSLTYMELRERVRRAHQVYKTDEDEYFNDLLRALDLDV